MPSYYHHKIGISGRGRRGTMASYTVDQVRWGREYVRVWSHTVPWRERRWRAVTGLEPRRTFLTLLFRYVANCEGARESLGYYYYYFMKFIFIHLLL